MKRNRSFSDNHELRGAAVLSAHPPPHDAVELGSVVTIYDLRSDEREEYALVPPDDADILRHRISTLSPMGRALYGRRVGETVEVDAPAGPFSVRIERILRAERSAEVAP